MALSSRIRVQNEVLQDRPEHSGAVVDLGLGLVGQVDRLRVTTALEIEDPVVAPANGLAISPWGMAAFVVAYVGLAAAVVALWLALPALALAAFLAMSASHFGGDWPRLARPARMLAGSSVILAPALFRSDEVGVLFERLTDEGAAAALTSVLRTAAVPALLVLAAAMLRSPGPAEIIELASIVALAWAAPPLVFFAIYFCGLHSPRHLAHTASMYGLSARSVAMAGGGLTVATVVGATAVFGVLVASGASLGDSAMRVIFVGLAALTVPHMAVLARADRASGAQRRAVFRPPQLLTPQPSEGM